MGQKLLKYYEHVERVKGREGKVELAKRTKIASIIAGGQAETPEILKAFREAVAAITGQPAPEV